MAILSEFARNFSKCFYSFSSIFFFFPFLSKTTIFHKNSGGSQLKRKYFVMRILVGKVLAKIYLLKVIIETLTRKRWEIWQKLTIKTPEQRQWHRSGVFIVNFEHIHLSELFLVFLLLALNKQILAGILALLSQHFGFIIYKTMVEFSLNGCGFEPRCSYLK